MGRVMTIVSHAQLTTAIIGVYFFKGSTKTVKVLLDMKFLWNDKIGIDFTVLTQNLNKNAYLFSFNYSDYS